MKISLQLNEVVSSIKRNDIDIAMKNDKFRVGVEYEFLVEEKGQTDVTPYIERGKYELEYMIDYTSKSFSKEWYRKVTKYIPKAIQEVADLVNKGENISYKKLSNMLTLYVADNKYYEHMYHDEDLKRSINSTIEREKPLNQEIEAKLYDIINMLNDVDESEYSTLKDILDYYAESGPEPDEPDVYSVLQEYIVRAAGDVRMPLLPLTNYYSKSDAERLVVKLFDKLRNDGTYDDMLQALKIAIFNPISDIDWSDFPYKHEVSDIYHGVTRKTGTWAIEPDPSLRKNGVEVISPALTVQNTFKSMQRIFEYIPKKGGHADCKSKYASCGLHVNISVKDRSWYKRMDYLKLALFIDEGFVWKFFEERKNNQYTVSVRERIKDLTWAELQEIQPKMAKELKTKIFDRLLLSLPKYSAINTINVDHVDHKQRRIEFRYLGGDYLGKFELIRLQILKFLAAMTIAMDPEYKKEEYKRKSEKLIRKLSNQE